MRNLDKKRLFIALNLPDDIKVYIADIIKRLKKEFSDGVKWVDIDGLHITLNFIGNTDKNKELFIIESLERIENKFGALKFKLASLSAFPNTKRPRVIYLDCEEVEKSAAGALQKTIKNEIEIRTDIKLDSRPWTAHITLGRIKNRGEVRNLDIEIEPRRFEIATFDLVESELKPTGAEYTLVKSYKL